MRTFVRNAKRAMKDNIQIPDDQAEKITTVGHAIAYIEEVVNK